MLPVAAGFARRENPDHTIDLVCKRCFRTVAASKCAADLDSVEQNVASFSPVSLASMGRCGFPIAKKNWRETTIRRNRKTDD
jgi:hypothetical protein